MEFFGGVKPLGRSKKVRMEVASWLFVALVAGGLTLGVSPSQGAGVSVPSAAYPTIQSALDLAPDNSLVVVAPGVYAEALRAVSLGRSLYFKSSGGAAVTAIDGGTVRSLLQVINGAGANELKNLTFDGFTFRRGKGTGATSPVLIADASPQFINCTFLDNTSTDKGGAVLAYSAAGIRTAPLFVNCLFQNNHSDQWGGAALIGNGGVMTTQHVQASFKDCRFLSNSATRVGGGTSQGGALAFATASGKISNCEFNGNVATYAGGAISAFTTFADGTGVLNAADTLEVQGSVFTNNHCDGVGAPPTEGGAIHAESNLTVKVSGSVFTGNFAQASGALNSYRANLEVMNSVFDGNRATGTGGLGFAGAIGVNNNDDVDADRREASLTVTDTLIRNSVAPVGGGIYFSGDLRYNKLGAVTLTNTTIENCRATTAGGSFGHGGGLFLDRASSSNSKLFLLNNTAEGFGGALVIVSGTQLALNNSYVIGNNAAIDPYLHNPTALPVQAPGTTIAYSNGSPSANLAVIAAIPLITLQGVDYLTYVVAPYRNPAPAIDNGVGPLPIRGSNPNTFAAGTSIAGRLADTTFTLTSSGQPAQTAFVEFVPNGIKGVPYAGAAVALPGRVEAEKFDNGGEAVAYHDLDAANNGGGYRLGESVDIFPDAAGASNGFGVGWVNAGEWLEYSVKVTLPGCYQLGVRAATPFGGSLSLQVGGVDVGSELVVPSTGGFASWQTFPVSGVGLGQGSTRLRLTALTDGVNLDYLEFTALGNGNPVARAGGPYTTVRNIARTLRASQSTDPDQACGDAVAKYEWDLNNDGVFGVFAADEKLSWLRIVTEICGGNCIEGVSYPLTLRVTDGSGLTGTDVTTFTVVAKLPAPNDFDGDGKSDFGAYDPPSGGWTLYKSTEVGPWTTSFGFPGTYPVSGDFDGDGKGDFGCYYPPQGKWYLFQSQVGFWETAFGYDGTIPVVGDFDGDGRTDFGCYYPPLGKWYLFQSQSGFQETAFGYEGTIPVVGDFDGDGRTDFGCYYPPLGKWYLFRSSLGFLETAFGYEGTIPIVGDFDGDGKADFGCYYPPLGKWYFYASSEGFSETQFGFDGTEPVIGDFDGDGQSDFAVFHGKTGNLYLFQSSAGFRQSTLGFIGDYPLGGRAIH